MEWRTKPDSRRRTGIAAMVDVESRLELVGGEGSCIFMHHSVRTEACLGEVHPVDRFAERRLRLDAGSRTCPHDRRCGDHGYWCPCSMLEHSMEFEQRVPHRGE